MLAEPAKQILPIPHELAGSVAVPGSKSHTNRALLLAALADGPTVLRNALFSDDSHYFSSALSNLGFEVSSRPQTKTLRVHGLSGQIPAQNADLFIGNAGTAARFLTAFLALGIGSYSLDGIARMRQRPIGDLISALNHLGAQINGTSHDSTLIEGGYLAGSRSLYPPVHIRANSLPGGETTIRGDVSSQYLSAVLMVAPKAQEPVRITVDGPLHSKPYIDLTLGVMADFGVSVHRQGYEMFKVEPQAYHSPGEYWIESDASAASYFFAAPIVCGGWVEVANISLASRQGDIAFLSVLEKMGCDVIDKGTGIRVMAPPQLTGIDIDMSDISDTAMTLAVIAPFASSPTTIRGIASSRLKETDRISATCTELKRLGIKVDEHPDGLTIFPCEQIRPADIQTYDDHRIAMAFSLIGLRVPGIRIENPQCVAKTFPGYFQVLDQLR